MVVPQFLKRELERRQQRNSRYSLRAFARDLDCDHATLSQWLRGTRPMSLDAEEHLFARLDLSAIERRRAREIDDQDLRVLAALARQALRTSPELGRMLGISTDDVNVAVARLARLELLRLDGSRWIIMEEAQ